MKKIFFLIVLIVMIACLMPKSTFALGIGPSISSIKNIMLGSTIDRKLLLIRKQGELKKNYEISVSGNGSKYIKFTEQEFTLEEGINNKDLNYKIITKGGEVGDYSVRIELKEKADVADNGANQVLSVVISKLNFSITDNRISNLVVSKFWISRSDESAREIVYFNVENKGNVSESISSAELFFDDIIKEKNSDVINNRINKVIKFSADNIILPFSSKQMSSTLDEGVPKGLYIISGKIKSRDKVVYEVKNYKYHNVNAVRVKSLAGMGNKLIVFWSKFLSLIGL